MGYDVHYVGSEEAGSVASLPWVEKGILGYHRRGSAERVINAVPFLHKTVENRGRYLIL